MLRSVQCGGTKYLKESKKCTPHQHCHHLPERSRETETPSKAPLNPDLWDRVMALPAPRQLERPPSTGDTGRR